MAKKTLKDYQEKRDFSRTPEPPGGPGAVGRAHLRRPEARRQPSPLRFPPGSGWGLEILGHPQGPSTDPKDKRLAVPTEDHPLALRRLRRGHPGGGIRRRHGAGVGHRPLPQPDGEEGGGHPHGPGGGPRPRQGLAGGAKTQRRLCPDPLSRRPDEAWLLVKADDEEADPQRNPVKRRPTRPQRPHPGRNRRGKVTASSAGVHRAVVFLAHVVGGAIKKQDHDWSCFLLG